MIQQQVFISMSREVYGTFWSAQFLPCGSLPGASVHLSNALLTHMTLKFAN